jgi:biotin carboxylase
LSFDISTRSYLEIYELAKANNVNGVVAYASDPAAFTAAYVSQKLGLPGHNPDTVEIMTDKVKWRSFLKSIGEITPQYIEVKSWGEIYDAGQIFPENFFVKPLDSSGSKGITELRPDFSRRSAERAWLRAISYSSKSTVILEKKIIRSGPQVAGDGFLSGGNLVHTFLGDENFNSQLSGIVPVGQTFPSTHPDSRLLKAKGRLQKVIKKLELQSGALNFDFVFDEDGMTHILEIGPRNGGCRIPEVALLSTGVNMISATVEVSLGRDSGVRDSNILIPWGTYMIHSPKAGSFLGLNEACESRQLLRELDIWLGLDEKVKAYFGSDNAIGSALLKLDDTNDTPASVVEDLNRNLVLLK